MQNIKHFTPYEPESPAFPGAAYLKSEDGHDWYDCQKLFSPDTLKFSYDPDGVITCITRDVSGLWPVGLSVAEVPDTTANRRADISGRWGFDGENIVDLMDAEKAREQKHAEINTWRNIQENANYVFAFNGRNWDYGKATQERLALSVQAAQENRLPDGFIWTDADNNDVPVTADELLKLGDAISQAMFTKGLQIHLRQRQMKEDIDRLTDTKAILDYPVDWPEQENIQ
ncbi:TPA_asm: DUF4376 domain-containing protein [Salmonella enterica subsp. enterica serovar Montevideo]|nr:DUF4376 domain-containing protein [Salmonella enterica subsp. enterica serovar Montevideo]